MSEVKNMALKMQPKTPTCDNVNTVHNRSFDRVWALTRGFMGGIIEMFGYARTARSVETYGMYLEEDM